MSSTLFTIYATKIIANFVFQIALFTGYSGKDKHQGILDRLQTRKGPVVFQSVIKTIRISYFIQKFISGLLFSVTFICKIWDCLVLYLVLKAFMKAFKVGIIERQ